MFAVFVACWASFFIVNLMTGICRHCHLDHRIFKSLLWLGYASSTVNPIVYTIFNRSFKQTFVRLLTCRQRRSDWGSGSWRRRRVPMMALAAASTTTGVTRPHCSSPMESSCCTGGGGVGNQLLQPAYCSVSHSFPSKNSS